MHIETIAIENYKSFYKRQIISLEHGFNLLVGTNNAGETSVLDVIDLDAGLGDPHRSAINIPQYLGLPIGPSQFEVTIATRYSELRQLVGNNQMFFPLASLQQHFQGVGVGELVRSFIDSDGYLSRTSNFGSGTSSVRFLQMSLSKAQRPFKTETAPHLA